MAVVELKSEGTIAIVQMNNGQNRQNLAFATEMNTVLDQVLADEKFTAMLLTSTDPKFFSNGVDVEWLGQKFTEQDFKAIKAFMYGMNSVFKKLLVMPLPVIATIGGHAFGNGAIIACACDFRFMKSDRGYFCFPEVDVSIPFLPGMTAFIQKAIPQYKLNRMKLTGERLGAQELAEHHIIEKACADADELMTEALAFATTFQKKRTIFGEHKKRMYRKIIKVIDEEDQEHIEALKLMV